MRNSTAFILVSLFVITSSSQAHTWHVERDGSGEFTVIQDAINIASSGDTIQIGPGTYPEYSWAWNNTELDVYSCAHATQSSLTIIGAGSDQTVIGGYGPDGHPTLRIAGVSMVNDGILYIRNLSVSGMDNGIHFEGAVVDVQNCNIRNNARNGVITWGREANRFEGCIFSNNAGAGIFFVNTTDNGVVRNCEFRDNYTRAIYISHCPNMLIESCTIHGGLNGVDIVEGAQVAIRGCQFVDRQLAGVFVSSSFLDIYDCYIGPGQCGIWFETWGRLRGSNNILEGCTEQTLRVGTDIDDTEIDFHGNHILNGGALSVDSRGVDELCPGDPCIIDLSGNYWGTDDPAQIAAWIEDYYDFPPDDWLHHAIVRFEPFSPVEVQTEKSTWGSVKSMFR